MAVNPATGSGGLGISNPGTSSGTSSTSGVVSGIADPTSAVGTSPDSAADAAAAEATNQKADAKAAEQTSNCSGGKCGTQVPGQCCEWMSKFNIACQKGLRPYTNSCSNCGGSGGSGNNICQACNGTGLEGSTGGGYSSGILLVKVIYIENESDMRPVYEWFGLTDLVSLNQRLNTSFSVNWGGHCVISLSKASVSLDNSQLVGLSKFYAKVVNTSPHSNYEISPDYLNIYIYNGMYYALQSDLNLTFVGGNF